MGFRTRNFFIHDTGNIVSGLLSDIKSDNTRIEARHIHTVNKHRNNTICKNIISLELYPLIKQPITFVGCPLLAHIGIRHKHEAVFTTIPIDFR